MEWGSVALPLAILEAFQFYFCSLHNHGYLLSMAIIDLEFIDLQYHLCPLVPVTPVISAGLVSTNQMP